MTSNFSFETQDNMKLIGDTVWSRLILSTLVLWLYNQYWCKQIPIMVVNSFFEWPGYDTYTPHNNYNFSDSYWSCNFSSHGYDFCDYNWNNFSYDEQLQYRPRGSRGGTKKIRQIKVVNGNRPTHRQGNNGVNRTNLLSIECSNDSNESIGTKNGSVGKQMDFALLNARSCRNKCAQIQDFAIENKLDFLAMTETWLNNDETDIEAALTPDGFSLHHAPRVGRAGGGVGILIKSNVKVKRISDRTFKTFEHIETILKLHTKTVRLVVIYRPPSVAGSTMSDFYEEFSDYLSNVSSCLETLLILGDFNIHTEDHNCHDAVKFDSILEDHHISQLVDFNTHNGGHRLDLMLIKNCDESFGKPFAKDLGGLYDHVAIMNNICIAKPGLLTITKHSRDIENIEEVNFTQDLKHIATSDKSLQDLSSPDDLADYYNSKLSAVIEEYAPLSSKTVIIRPNTSWYNATLRQAKVLRRRLERKWKKSGRLEDYQNYSDQCSVVSKYISQYKTEFLSNKVIESEGDAKKLFHISKQLLGNSKKCVLPESNNNITLANKFNNFFLDKIVKIRDEISNAPTLEAISQAEQLLFPGSTKEKFHTFKPTTEAEIKKIILKSSSATCDLDPIPTHLLKENLDTIVPLITKLVNASLQHGKFPEIFKHADIVPLLKKDGLDPDNLKNYRPVSNLPFVSKVIEQVVADRLKTHLTNNNMWEKNQSAYRAFHSTETALIRVHNDIMTSLNRKKMVALVLLDLSAAFDTISHRILLDRLHDDYGVSGVSLKWFESYLQHRTQSVKIGNDKSDKIELPCGVPQGSVLGPILFSLYVRPVAHIARSFDIENMFYADDSQLYIEFNHSDGSDQSINRLEQCISGIRRWMQTNFLKLNDSKTEFIIFGSRYSEKKCSERTIQVGDSSIEAVASVRNLGSYMDKNMTMEAFVAIKIRNLNFLLRKIFRIRRFLTLSACKTLVQSLVISRLDYCNSLLFGISNYHMKRLQRVQNTAARLVCQATRYDSAMALRYRLHWLPVPNRVIFRILVFVYKCILQTAPVYLSELLILDTPTRITRQSTKFKLKISRCNNSFGNRAFFNSGPTLWNSLPESIKISKSLNSFKKSLKTYLFRLSYNV